MSVTPVPMLMQNTQRAQSIVLPNGSKYDPFQIYDTPQTPSEFVASSKVLAKTGLSEIGNAQVENAIGSWFDTHSALVGLRATFTAYSAYNVAYTCTARLIGISMRPFQDFPVQIPAGMGGEGSGTPGMMGAQISYTFDQITNWTDS